MKRWAPAVAILGAILASALYGLKGQPILGDRAYFVYMAQAVHRGDALYGDTTFGYPPVAPLITGAMMDLGDPFGVPTYLIPRVVGVLLLLAATWLLFAVTRNATGRESTALLASLTLSGFGYLVILSVANAEPKMFVVVGMLGALLAMQRSRPMLAGVATGLAIMSWQPAVVVLVAILAQAALSGPGRRRRLAKILGGCLVGCLPAIVYIVGNGQWEAFAYQAIARKLGTSQPGALTWIATRNRAFAPEWFVFPLAAITFAGGLLAGVWKRARRVLPDWRNHGGVLFATLAWMCWNTIDFQSSPDWIPLLPLVAYWSALGVQIMADRVSETGRPWLETRVTAAMVYGLFIVPLYGDALLYRQALTLSQQIGYVGSIVGSEPYKRFIAFEADEFYVLTETSAPIRYTRIAPWIDEFIDSREEGGVPALAAAIASLRPEVVIIRETRTSRLRMRLERVISRIAPVTLDVPSGYEIESLPARRPLEVYVFPPSDRDI